MKKQEKMSLLKRFTNFDNIRAMTVDKMTDFLWELVQQCDPFDCNDCPFASDCTKDGVKNWLESEVTKVW